MQLNDSDATSSAQSHNHQVLLLSRRWFFPSSFPDGMSRLVFINTEKNVGHKNYHHKFNPTASSHGFITARFPCFKTEFSIFPQRSCHFKLNKYPFPSGLQLGT